MPNALRILVTGGLGTVGSTLVSELRSRGHEVWICDLPHHHDRLYRRCDIGRFRQLQAVLDEADFDLVYNLAAEFGRWNGEDFYETMWRSNVVGTKHLLVLQKERGFRLVHSSSSEVYGDYDGVMSEDVMDEHEVRQLNDYALSKWVNEIQIENSAAADGTETVRVRLFNTYGPGERYSSYRSVICLFCYRALHNMPYTVYTDHKRTSTFITDTVRTLANIATRFRPGRVYNIGGSDYHDIKTCSDLILEYLGKDDSLVTYREREPHTTRLKRVDVGRAVRELDHESRIDLEEGIPRTLEWMKAEYGLE